MKQSNVPIASRVAFWMVVAIVSLTIVASVIASIVLEDAYWGGFAVGYFGGPFILLGWLTALLFGVAGLVQSFRRHSGKGAFMSLTPWVPTLLIAAFAAAG